MKYVNTDEEHEFSSILCGRLENEGFVHMKRNINIYVLIVVEDGVLNIEMGGTKYKVHKGEMIILLADIPHCGFVDEDSKKRIKYFWAHFIINSGAEVADSKSGRFSMPVYFKLTDYPRIRILYNQLLDVYKLSGTRKKYCDFLFTALCCEIAGQEECVTVSGNQAVNRAAAWIELNIEKRISLAEAAQAIGYNKRYLARIFKDAVGLTVNDFITDKKIILAKQLLVGSDETVTSVAQKLGFDDTGYFMRLFKKREGLTCIEYRNAYTKMYMNRN